jgi:hypothetical protein
MKLSKKNPPKNAAERERRRRAIKQQAEEHGRERERLRKEK